MSKAFVTGEHLQQHEETWQSLQVTTQTPHSLLLLELMQIIFKMRMVKLALLPSQCVQCRLLCTSWRAQKPCVSVIRREQKREAHAQLFE